MNTLHCFKAPRELHWILGSNLGTSPELPATPSSSELTGSETFKALAVKLFCLLEILELSNFKFIQVLLTPYKPRNLRTPENLRTSDPIGSLSPT